jgi:hypothetical protein
LPSVWVSATKKPVKGPVSNLQKPVLARTRMTKSGLLIRIYFLG